MLVKVTPSVAENLGPYDIALDKGMGIWKAERVMIRNNNLAV